MLDFERIGKITPKTAREVGPSRLGIGFEKLDRKAFDPENAYEPLAKLGVHYIRLQSGWQRTERAKGVYDFAWLDEIVDRFLSNGQEPWIDLCYGNELYTDYAKTVFGAVGCPPIVTEEEKAAWRNYVTAVVRHFRGRVTWYEIWNEPNLGYSWKHPATGAGEKPWEACPSAAEYGLFARETGRFIHEADGGAKAIGGVVSSIDLGWLRQMFDTGVLDDIDAVCFHRYTPDELPAIGQMRALRALIDLYRPEVGIVQGESGTQSCISHAGALHSMNWTPEKQAKYCLRHRLVDLASDLVFTSHFTALDMFEALNGTVGNQASYNDFGYFGVLGAQFNAEGRATGTYSPKPSYTALQNLCALFTGDVKGCELPVSKTAMDSHLAFGRDEDGPRVITLGFKGARGSALAYWNSVSLMRETYDGTISFQAPCLREPPKVVDLMTGDIFAVPEAHLLRGGDGRIATLKNMPLTDSPLLLAFDGFAGN